MDPSNKEDVGIGLLSAALATLAARGVNPWQALGQGGLLGIQSALENRQARRRDELAQSERDYQKAQIEHLGMQNEQVRQALEQQRKIGTLAQQSMNPGYAPFQSEDREGNAVPMPGQGPSFDQQKFLSGLMAIDPLKAIPLLQKDTPKVGEFKPEHYTPQSLAKFMQTRNASDLVTLDKAKDQWQDIPAPPGGQGQQWQRNNATGEIRAVGTRAPVTNVSITNPMETEEQKVIGKSRGEQYSELQKKALGANSVLTSLNAIESLLKDVDTNAMTPVGMKLSSYARVVGVDVDPQLPAKQAAQKIVNKFALDARNTAEGGGMPGAMSDADREFLLNTVPNLTDTKEGRATAIEVQRRILKRQQKIAAMAQAFLTKNKTFDVAGFSGELQKYAEENPLFAGLQGYGSGGQGKITVGAPQPASAPRVVDFSTLRRQ